MRVESDKPSLALKEARAQAEKLGWSCIGDQIYCPHHTPKEPFKRLTPEEYDAVVVPTKEEIIAVWKQARAERLGIAPNYCIVPCTDDAETARKRVDDAAKRLHYALGRSATLTLEQCVEEIIEALGKALRSQHEMRADEDRIAVALGDTPGQEITFGMRPLDLRVKALVAEVEARKKSEAKTAATLVNLREELEEAEDDLRREEESHSTSKRHMAQLLETTASQRQRLEALEVTPDLQNAYDESVADRIYLGDRLTKTEAKLAVALKLLDELSHQMNGDQDARLEAALKEE